MSKVLAIPDIHLKPVIFDRAGKILESGQADFAVQLGDLVDDWDEDFNDSLYARTIRRAIEFHKKFPNTLWCMGNHDYGYYHRDKGKRESGHSVFVEPEMSELIKEMKQSGLKQEIAHHVDNAIFSHAGLTSDWVAMLTIDEAEGYTMDDYIETLVNEAAPEELWDERSPIWVRPQESNVEIFSDCFQVVGHTPVEKVELKNGVLSTDVFSTYPNGAPFGERKFVIVDTVKKTWWYAEETDESQEA